MKKILHYAVFLSVIVFTRCEEEYKVTAREYPRVITEPVTAVAPSSATLHGELLHLGTEPIVEYGFVWNDDNSSSNFSDAYSEKIIIDTPASVGKYSKTVSLNFEPGVVFIRAFAKTTKRTVYGNEVGLTIE